MVAVIAVFVVEAEVGEMLEVWVFLESFPMI